MDNTSTNISKLPDKPPKRKAGRPPNNSFTEKETLERQLKKIWSNLKAHKATEVISAASLYAELRGWKVKKPEVNEEGEIMRIEFQKDLQVIKNPQVTKKAISEPQINMCISEPPINKIIEAPIIKEEATTTTTTTQIEEAFKVEFE